MARVERDGAGMTSTAAAGAALDTAYAPAPVRRFPRRALAATAEERRWRAFRKRTEHPGAMRGRVSCIDFCPRSPHIAVVTAQARIALYDPTTHESTKETHPKDTVYCTRWRGDGRMLVTSGEHPTIKVWTPQAGIGKMVRELRADLERSVGHTRAVHTVHFLADKQRVLSGSDDKTAVVWDMPTQEQVLRLVGHSDYVRAAAPHPYAADVCVTAGHDGRMLLWDLRAGAKPQREWTVQDPVTCAAFHPSGGIVACASGTDVTVWDASAGAGGGGGDPLFLLSNHTKDITSLCFNDQGSRLLTGGVDRHVKVYETECCAAVHTLTFPEPVFAVGLSPCGRTLAVGTLEGRLHLRSRTGDAAGGEAAGESDEEVEMYSGMGDMTIQRRRNWNVPVSGAALATDHVVEREHQARLKRYDVALRKFNYHKALDEALAERRDNKARRDLIYSVIEELVRRNGLRIALAGRSAAQLGAVLEFVRDGITDPRYCTLLSAVLGVVLEIYHPVVHEAPDTLRLLASILGKVTQQVAALGDMAGVRAMLDAVSQQARVRELKRRRVAEDGADGAE